jgi:hypothetical protein
MRTLMLGELSICLEISERADDSRLRVSMPMSRYFLPCTSPWVLILFPHRFLLFPPSSRMDFYFLSMLLLGFKRDSLRNTSEFQ